MEVSSEQDALLIESYEEIGKVEGFVVAPFDNAEHPIILIQPDNLPFPQPLPRSGQGSEYSCRTKENRAQYERAFNCFHEAIKGGRFTKLVLSRQKTINVHIADAREVFFEACRRYPRLMIILVSTPQTGIWIVATPEKLLTGDGSWWRTMALAGTMPYEEGYQEWSMKNRDEQHYVEAYIEEHLRQCSTEIIKDGPHTQRAGNLVHLCTDFRFHIAPGCYIGELLASLHPTPAV